MTESSDDDETKRQRDLRLTLQSGRKILNPFGVAQDKNEFRMTLVVVGLFERAELSLIVRRTINQTGGYQSVSALGHWGHEAVRMP
ncbi:MAG: hypothetical protein HOF71_01395 [Chloroflexi bacterium]|nr:hypothetical protein [Chloroflexota bacterium]MBT5252289.1 hypothetical protein [Chloroflexota bacterium]